jgi:hypothetical protein
MKINLHSNLNTGVNFKANTPSMPAVQQSNLTSLVARPNNEPSKGILSKFIDTLAGARKLQIKVEEYTSGIVNGTGKGLAAGSVVMALGWAAQKLQKNPITKDHSWVGTPIKTVFNAAKSILGKIVRLPNKTIAQVIKYPVYTGPKEIFNYVKTANIGKAAKVVAPLIGLAVLGLSLIKAKLKINQRTADTDHSLYTGHRTV